MSTISSQEVISIVKGEIEDYDAHAGRIRETGSVIWVGDYRICNLGGRWNCHCIWNRSRYVWRDCDI